MQKGSPKEDGNDKLCLIYRTGHWTLAFRGVAGLDEIPRVDARMR